MARLPRFFVENQSQHVIQRGNNREPIFVTNEDYRFYLNCLSEAAEKHDCFIHAYVLMTNHVHLLVSPHNENSIPKIMQSVGRRYVQYFNYNYKRTGTLWEGRYKATLIDTDNYFLTCMRYIELNPVRADMVALPGDYPWSSFQANAYGEKNKLLVKHSLYSLLGQTENERQIAYRQLFRVQLDAVDVNAIREATNKAWVLGNDRFRQRIEGLAGRRAAPVKSGRPKIV